MEWLDRGYILSVRLHGESALIVSILTEANGRHPGLIRGGGSAKRRGLYQPGNFLEVNWRARLPDHLGTYSCELTRAHSADFLDTPNKLLALCSAVTLLDNALPERQPAPEIFGSFGMLLDEMKSENWAVSYVRWELGLLSNLGFGLDLSKCAATGGRDNLTHVSPKSGRAVSKSAAKPYEQKLLKLPSFLLGSGRRPLPEEIVEGLLLTGFFLRRYVLGDQGRGLSGARERLIQGLT